MRKSRKVVLFKKEQVKEDSTVRLHPAVLFGATLSGCCSASTPSAHSRHRLCETQPVHHTEENSLKLVYNSSTSQFNPFHVANNNTYNHRSYIWKNWDTNGPTTDQVMHLGYSGVGFSPAWKKPFLKEPLGSPLAASLLNDIWTTERHAHIN